mgnify:CR=1 FL=1
MYESWYGLRERAFLKTPDPRYLYLGESHEEALEQLQFAVEGEKAHHVPFLLSTASSQTFGRYLARR